MQMNFSSDQAYQSAQHQGLLIQEDVKSLLKTKGAQLNKYYYLEAGRKAMNYCGFVRYRQNRCCYVAVEVSDAAEVAG